MSTNLYDPHPLMIDSGTFWRCEHGTTGFGAGLEWVGCPQCAASNPDGYRRFHPGAAEYDSWGATDRTVRDE